MNPKSERGANQRTSRHAITDDMTPSQRAKALEDARGALDLHDTGLRGEHAEHEALRAACALRTALRPEDDKAWIKVLARSKSLHGIEDQVDAALVQEVEAGLRDIPHTEVDSLNRIALLADLHGTLRRKNGTASERRSAAVAAMHDSIDTARDQLAELESSVNATRTRSGAEELFGNSSLVSHDLDELEKHITPLSRSVQAAIQHATEGADDLLPGDLDVLQDLWDDRADRLEEIQTLANDGEGVAPTLTFGFRFWQQAIDEDWYDLGRADPKLLTAGWSRDTTEYKLRFNNDIASLLSTEFVVDEAGDDERAPWERRLSDVDQLSSGGYLHQKALALGAVVLLGQILVRRTRTADGDLTTADLAHRFLSRIESFVPSRLVPISSPAHDLDEKYRHERAKWVSPLSEPLHDHSPTLTPMDQEIQWLDRIERLAPPGVADFSPLLPAASRERFCHVITDNPYLSDGEKTLVLKCFGVLRPQSRYAVVFGAVNEEIDRVFGELVRSRAEQEQEASDPSGQGVCSALLQQWVRLSDANEPLLEAWVLPGAKEDLTDQIARYMRTDEITTMMARVRSALHDQRIRLAPGHEAITTLSELEKEHTDHLNGEEFIREIRDLPNLRLRDLAIADAVLPLLALGGSEAMETARKSIDQRLAAGIRTSVSRGEVQAAVEELRKRPDVEDRILQWLFAQPDEMLDHVCCTMVIDGIVASGSEAMLQPSESDRKLLDRLSDFAGRAKLGDVFEDESDAPKDHMERWVKQRLKRTGVPAPPAGSGLVVTSVKELKAIKSAVSMGRRYAELVKEAKATLTKNPKKELRAIWHDTLDDASKADLGDLSLEDILWHKRKEVKKRQLATTVKLIEESRTTRWAIRLSLLPAVGFTVLYFTRSQDDEASVAKQIIEGTYVVLTVADTSLGVYAFKMRSVPADKLGRLGKFALKAGRVLGPVLDGIGAVLDGMSAYERLSKGDTVHGVTYIVSAAAGITSAVAGIVMLAIGAGPIGWAVLAFAIFVGLAMMLLRAITTSNQGLIDSLARLQQAPRLVPTELSIWGDEVILAEQGADAHGARIQARSAALWDLLAVANEHHGADREYYRRSHSHEVSMREALRALEDALGRANISFGHESFPDERSAIGTTLTTHRWWIADVTSRRDYAKVLTTLVGKERADR